MTSPVMSERMANLVGDLAVQILSVTQQALTLPALHDDDCPACLTQEVLVRALTLAFINHTDISTPAQRAQLQAEAPAILADALKDFLNETPFDPSDDPRQTVAGPATAQ